VWFRVFQDGGDDVGLVFSSDRRVATISERKSQNPLVTTVIPGPVQPFGEERRPQVRRPHGGAVQQAFANPVVACGVAVRLAACGNLGHVHHCPDASFAGRLCEDGDGVEQVSSNGVVDNFSAFVLTPQEKTSQIAFLGNGLETLYRCKITETLNLNKKAACCAAKDLRKLVRNIPTEIPEGEIYLYTWGGRIVVDGIEVIQEAFPTSLRVGRAYLVLLAHDEPAKVGMPLLGEEGIYEVRVDGRFVSKSPTSIPLANEIREKFDNSPQRLKDYIERRRAAIK
jgi:hypothetical protein